MTRGSPRARRQAPASDLGRKNEVVRANQDRSSLSSGRRGCDPSNRKAQGLGSRPQRRPPDSPDTDSESQREHPALLIGIVPAIGMMIGLGALGSGFAHPGYAEALVNFGIALLAFRRHTN